MQHVLTAFLLACLLGAGSKPVFADEGPKSAEHLAVAAELLKVLQLDKTFAQSVDAGLEMQMKANPNLVPYRSVMQEFFRKYMSWESLKDDVAKAYADEFTIEELKEITAFYKTPTGQKVALCFPALIAKGGALGQQRVQEHMPELKEMIAKRKAELDNK